MSNSQASILIVGASGKLGQTAVMESLSRGYCVDVLVRDKKALEQELGDKLKHVSKVHEGNAEDMSVIESAIQANSTVILAKGAKVAVVKAVAESAKKKGAKKLIFVAAAINLPTDEDDTPYYKECLDKFPGAEKAYQAHQKCIDSVREVGIDFVCVCPGWMEASPTENKNAQAVQVKVNRPAGDHVSYEAVAKLMVDAVDKSDWDGKLVTVAYDNKNAQQAQQ